MVRRSVAGVISSTRFACAWRIAKFLNISCEVAILLGLSVRDLAVLFLHLLTTAARLAGPGGARSVVAESLLLKQQLLILNRSRKRSPRLRLSDRIIAGFCALLMRPRRLLRSAIVLKPSTLLSLHRALTKRKYRRLTNVSSFLSVGPAQLGIRRRQAQPPGRQPRLAFVRVESLAEPFDVPVKSSRSSI